jgi:hypothetical protein
MWMTEFGTTNPQVASSRVQREPKRSLPFSRTLGKGTHILEKGEAAMIDQDRRDDLVPEWSDEYSSGC